jgi:membrane protease YdiL (CAAX protease family)
MYYTEDVVASVAWWGAVLAGVLILVWSFTFSEFQTIAILQLVMLLAGKFMFPGQHVGRVYDNPVEAKTRRERRYTSGRMKTLVSIGIGLAGVLVVQVGLTSTLRLGLVDLTADLLTTYSVMSAAISESYLLHWGLQTNLAIFLHPWVGIAVVPVVALLLHSFAYGTSGVALLVVAGSFAVLAGIFEYSRRVSVPIVVHLIVNMLVVA